MIVDSAACWKNGLDAEMIDGRIEINYVDCRSVERL